MRKQPRIAAALAAFLLSGGMIAADIAAAAPADAHTTGDTARKAKPRRARARRAQAPPTAANFARLRQCESGGNYSINSGNGYYGAYQFSASTWRSLGFTGLPHQASAAVQDTAAAKLQAQQGWRPWPGCSRKLRLR
jgi:resuscitation-promoting factor RpfA